MHQFISTSNSIFCGCSIYDLNINGVNIALASIIAGAISATVYVRKETTGDMKKVLRRIINGRKNIGLHLVYENGVRDRLFVGL